ncbi:MAG TPA: hypothetical protein VKF81_10945 [Blastocatellia bacterium]|nr:hypothetical protein [Blastocatellia bacterium]
MKGILTLVLLLFLLPTVVFAAQVYGSLKEGGRPVGRGCKVVVDCSGELYERETDDYGSYSVYAARKGKCTLQVYYQGQWSSRFDIYSYDDPVRYDFDLVRDGNGQYFLRRK